MVTVIQVVFFLISALILGAGLLTVTVRNLVHAALWLIAGFFGVGALYLLMQAEFAAVVQVLIYVGAIAVLILFAIMLTPDVEAAGEAPVFRRRWPVLVVASALFGLLIIPTMLTHTWALAGPADTQSGAIAGVREIGTSFMREYLLPFELASVLLLAALVGAITIGFDEETRKRVLTLAEEVRKGRLSAARRQESELSETDRAEINHEGHEEHEDGDRPQIIRDTTDDAEGIVASHQPPAESDTSVTSYQLPATSGDSSSVIRPSSGTPATSDTPAESNDPPTETKQGEKQDG